MPIKWMFKALLGLALVLMIPGCGTTTNVTPLTDDQFAASIAQKVQGSVGAALSLGVEFGGSQKAEILKEALFAEGLLKGDVLPWFTNTPLSQITSTTANDILAKLEGKIPGNLATVIGAAITLITTEVPFPANPANGIDARTQKAIVAGLNAAITAIDQVEKANSGSAPPTAKAARKIMVVTQK